MALVVKNLPAVQETQIELGSIPGLGRYSGGGNGNLLQYSYLENPMDRGAWWATVHGVVKSQTGLNRHSTHRILRIRNRKNSGCQRLGVGRMKCYCLMGIIFSFAR